MTHPGHVLPKITQLVSSGPGNQTPVSHLLARAPLRPELHCARLRRPGARGGLSPASGDHMTVTSRPLLELPSPGATAPLRAQAGALGVG